MVGGPGACCGIIHAKWEGQIAAGERVTTATLTRFEGFKPEKVLSWCPSCQIHLGESVAGLRPTSFDLDHVTAFLVARLDDLRRKFVRPLRRRVVLHAHRGLTDLGENVARLLGAIPGLELVETVFEPGYTCGGSGCDKAPALRAIEHGRLLGRVPHDDVLKRFRLYGNWKLVAEDGQAYLKANGINVDRAWLEGVLPELFSLAEFKGGLDCFGSSG